MPLPAPGLAPTQGRPGSWRRWQLLVPASAAVLVAAADTYVVVVVLTSIMGGAGVGVDQLQRATPIITGFLLGYIALLPLIGRLADRHGRRPVFIGCLLTFAFGSALTASAHSLSVVIAGRGIQGAGGGGLVPVTLSLVAALWEADERGLPLGVVSAVQELGSVLGPLYGAGIVAVSGWRTIFWINLPLVVLLGATFVLARSGPQLSTASAGPQRSAAPAGSQPSTARRRRPDVVGALLATLGVAAVLLALWAPPSLANSVRFGSLYSPRVGGTTWSQLTTPIAFAAVGILAVFVAWEAVAPRSFQRLVNVRNVRRVFTGVDLPGALLLAGLLACVIVMFSTTDPSRQVIASSWPVLTPVAVVLLGALVYHERRVDDPIIARPVLAARPAWGSLIVNFAVGAALMATLVAVPLFAGATTGKSQVSSALVLVRFLVAVPFGALAGGWLCRRFGDPVIAAGGMVVAALTFLPMTSWGQTAFTDPLRIGGQSLGFTAADVELVVCGLGFGLVIAPINNAVLRAVPAAWHGLATALTVVARMIGMLVGLSILVAIALRTFYGDQRRLGSPLTLCPNNPTHCPAYNQGTKHALLGELHTIFAGAAVSAAIAAIAALVLLRRLPAHAGQDPVATPAAR